MNEWALVSRVDDLVRWALGQTAGYPGLAGLHRLLTEAEVSLHSPFQVAIIGRVSCGKSTALNALLGRPILATGWQEVTFNVTQFQWGESPSLLVHYKDGSQPQPRPFAALEELTRRSEEQLTELLAVDRVVAHYPHDLLRRIHLVDTPGLASFYGDDSENTLRLIRLTEQEAIRADAVLYLFDRSIAQTEQNLIEEFSGPHLAQMTPLNAVGVLTKVDLYWTPEGSEADPMTAAARVIKRRCDHPAVRRTLYTIVPFCGPLALGAQMLTPAEFEALAKLAQLPEQRFARLTNSANSFTASTDPDLSVTSAERQQLLSRLGWYGVWRAYQRIRTGRAGREQLTKALLEDSGLPQLHSLILSHFGNRAFLIKLDRLLREITALDMRLRPRVSTAEQGILREVITRIESLRMEQHPLKELGVLRRYYAGGLRLNDHEVNMLLQVTGETGPSAAERLGLPDAPWDQLLSVAQERVQYWKGVEVDGGTDSATAEAARVVAYSFERIAYHVSEALKHPAASKHRLDSVL